jgi:hypothetical protein
MTRSVRLTQVLLSGAAALAFSAALSAPAGAAPFEAARIFIEYNSTDNDLGFHVFLDAEDWKSVKIVNPSGATIFQVAGKGPYGKPNLGLSELSFEGAEPTLDDFPLEDLLALFPEGPYTFSGVTADGIQLSATSTFSHAVPDGPSVSTEVDGDTIVIRWQPVTGPPPGFPNEKIEIVGYQIIVEPFQVTLPATSTEVTLPREFAETLEPGRHGFEVLAIDASGNQTITESSFDTTRTAIRRSPGPSIPHRPAS